MDWNDTPSIRDSTEFADVPNYYCNRECSGETRDREDDARDTCGGWGNYIEVFKADGIDGNGDTAGVSDVPVRCRPDVSTSFHVALSKCRVLPLCAIHVCVFLFSREYSTGDVYFTMLKMWFSTPV